VVRATKDRIPWSAAFTEHRSDHRGDRVADSKTPNGIVEVPLTSLAIEAFQSPMAILGEGPFLFPSNRNPSGHQTALKTVWQKTLRTDEWVTQMHRQSDAQVFKKYSQMKLQMKREALVKLNRRANEMAPVAADVLLAAPLCTVTVHDPFVHSSYTVGIKTIVRIRSRVGECFRMNGHFTVGA
jgi:hypothetical protein